MSNLNIFILLAIAATTSANQSLSYFHWTQITSPFKDFVSAQNLKFNLPITGRIVGGSQAAANQFPHQATIFVVTEEIAETGPVLCRGSIISENVILTAAQCLSGSPIQGLIILGMINFETVADAVGILVSPSQMVLHLQYLQDSLNFDIAIIRLPYAVPSHANIQVITLPTIDQVNSLVIGEPAIASGWGFTTEELLIPSFELRYVTLPIVSNTECHSAYGTKNVTSSHVCISGDGENGICDGDIGGPLTVIRNGQSILVGITSFGSSLECELGYPSVFTRVGSYLDWIQATANIILPITTTSTVNPNNSIARSPNVAILLIILLVL